MNSSDKKNQTLDTRKKPERVFIPELHSHPDLMSYSEKLELAEELFSERLAPLIEEHEGEGEVLEVEGNIIVLLLLKGGQDLAGELVSAAKEETGGVFALEVRFG